jgi:hypothetical protein
VDGDAVDATIGAWLADRLRPVRHGSAASSRWTARTLRGSARDGHQVHLLAALDHHDGAVLAGAGVQHVIMNFAETNETDLIELLGSRVLPQVRNIARWRPTSPKL